MATFSQKHPQMAAKIADQIEYGLTPDQIIQSFVDADVKRNLEKEEGPTFEENFADEILVISQALAYRELTSNDTDELWKLLSAAYEPEVHGDEAFREGEPVSTASLNQVLNDASYHWLVIEAPSGRGVELDGVILGAACFSTDGVSRRNGVVEGKLGSIRFLAVLPRYHGFCVGQRLLSKVELEMVRLGCCKSMCCIPTPRLSATEWIVRRGYFDLGAVLYPAASLGHTLLQPDGDEASEVQLVRFVKDFKESPPHQAVISASKLARRVTQKPQQCEEPSVANKGLAQAAQSAQAAAAGLGSLEAKAVTTGMPSTSDREDEPIIPDVD